MKYMTSFRWSDVSGRFEFNYFGLRSGADEVLSWFSDDIQMSASSIKRWIELFNAVANGTHKGGYLGTGNAHHVGAIGEEVYLECDFTEEKKVLMTRTQIISALEHYRAFTESELRNRDREPSPFSIEYEFEGDEALARYSAIGGTIGLTQEEIDEDNREI